MTHKLAFLALAFSGALSAQLPPQASSLAIPATSTDIQITLASGVGLAAGQTLFVDREAMSISRVSGAIASVLRGTNGTRVSAHNAAAVAYFGRGDAFLSNDLAGACSADSTLVFVRISSGATFGCTAGAWGQLNGGGGGGGSTTTDASQLISGTLPFARLPIGTTANTVPAANDSRIVGAVQTSSIGVANGIPSLDGTARVRPVNQTVNAFDIGAESVSNLYRSALANIAANKATFTDGTGSNYYKAAPGYISSYVSDTALAVDGMPEAFPMADVKTLIQHYVAGKSTSTQAPLPLGSIPIALAANGAPGAQSVGSNPWCAGFDGWCNWPTAEGVFSLVHLEKQYSDRTGDLSQFTADATVLDTAMGTVRLDTTTKIPVSPTGAEYVCFGFQESIRFTGLLGTCAMQMWRTSTELATLYGLAGNSTLQTKYAGYATTIAANLGTSSALWNSGAGMFNGATIQDAQIDTTASALFCSYKIPSPNATAQCAAISAYFVTNAATLTYKGYVRQGNIDFATVGMLTVGGAGSTPYDASDTRNNAGSYQRGGFWSHVNQAVAQTMALTNTAAAAKLMADFANNPDPTMEYYAPNSSGGPANGFSTNLESPVGIVAASRLLPGLVPAQTFTSGTGTPASSCVNGSDYYQNGVGLYICLSGAFTGPLGMLPALSGPVQKWLLNEGTGTTFADSSGNANTLTASGSGAITFSAKTGMPGSAAHFAAGAVLDAANHTNTDFDGSGPFSVNLWCSFDTLGTAMQLFVPLSSVPRGYQIVKDVSNQIAFYLINTYPSNAIEIHSNATITDTSTHMITVAYDSPKQASSVRIYLDGVLATNTTVSNNSLTGSTSSGQNLRIGGNVGATGSFVGFMADIRAWARGIVASEITGSGSLFALGAQ